MKSRITTYLLLTAVASVWGVIAWKIFAPVTTTIPAMAPRPAAAEPTPPKIDTLLLDYPDPFLKGVVVRNSSAQSVIRALPAPKARRERVNIVHLGTVTSKNREFHILTIGEEQYEIARGEAAGDFILTGYDCDSLYLRKESITYSVKRCK